MEEETISHFAEETSTRFLTKELLIGGLVSPVSGQIILSDTDLIAQGREPIALKRIYQPPFISDEKHANPYYESWSFVPQKLLEVHQNDKVRIRDANGTTLDFIVTERSCNLITNRSGLCNTVAETPSGIYELANTHIQFEKDKKTVNVLDPSGIKRVYKRHKKQGGITFYLLEKEVFSNGRVMRYEYQGNVLSQITSLDPHEQHEYATLKFDYEGDTNLVCTTDRGKRATYRFGKVKKGPSLLTHISSPSYRNTHIDYSKTYLLRLEEGKQRNCLGIYKGFPSSPSSSYFRVHELCFPVGEKDALETVYMIDYTPAVAGIRTGLTIAKRKDGSSIHYHIGKNLLLEKIEFYDKERKLRKQNIYTWQAPGSIFVPNRSHWLQSCEIQDEHGALLIKKTFHYDRFGNVEKELLQGDLTGDGTIVTLTIRRTFSKEGRHLLLSEEIEDKTLTTYTYLPNTNLPVSKILRDREKVRQRTFWEYDSCNNLIKKILDDGNRKKREDLRDVTERRITCYILKTEAPHLHLPHAIEERYLEDNEEKLLKTTI